MAHKADERHCPRAHKEGLVLYLWRAVQLYLVEYLLKEGKVRGLAVGGLSSKGFVTLLNKSRQEAE